MEQLAENHKASGQGRQSARWDAVKGMCAVIVGTLIGTGMYVNGYWDGVGHDTNLGPVLLVAGGVVALVVLIVALWRAAR